MPRHASSYLVSLQVIAQHAYANGSTSAIARSRACSGRAAAKEPSALVRAACLDHATGVGIAVSHINEGKLEEAMEILDYIISATTGPHNTGAHIARGTARAMLRDLEGDIPTEACLQCCREAQKALAGSCSDCLPDCVATSGLLLDLCSLQNCLVLPW